MLLASSAAAARASDPQHVLDAYKAATGGAAWSQVTILDLKGRFEAGASPGTFTEIIDHRSGTFKRAIETGPLEDLAGYDGAPWVAQNGIVTQIDLPALIADAQTRAYAMRDGWWDRPATAQIAMPPAAQTASAEMVAITPRAGSPINVWFDRTTHLITRTITHEDGGEVTTLYADWRRVKDIKLPFRREEIDPGGDHTVYQVESAQMRPAASPDGELARPASEPHGTLASATAATKFRFTAMDHGHIVTPATVDGRPVQLIFDTGAANYFTPQAAKRLGLITGGGVNLSGVSGGGVSGGFANAAEIKIGGAGLRNEAVIVGPLPFVATHPRAGMDIDGLTGFEFLAAFRTTIDYDARTLSFTPLGAPAPRGGVTVPFFSDEHNIYVKARIDTATGLFRLDTGDGGGVTVFKNFADRNGLFAAGGRSSIAAGGLGGTLRTWEYTGAHFTLAGTTFENMPVTVADARSGSFASNSLAGNLGAAVLGRFKLTFDYQARSIALQPGANATRPFQANHAGLSVTQTRADRLDVLSVQPDSAAFRSGIRPGDAILYINGRSVVGEGLGVFDLTPLLAGPHALDLTLDRKGRSIRVEILPDRSQAP